MSGSAKIKKARNGRLLSQAEVSNEIGRSQFWVSLVERDKVVLDPAATQQMMIAIERAADRKAAIEKAVAAVNEEFDAMRDLDDHHSQDFCNRKLNPSDGQ